MNQKCEYCNGSGIRVPATPGCEFQNKDLDGRVILERCDSCERFDSDTLAAKHYFPIHCIKEITGSCGYLHTAVGKGQRLTKVIELYCN